MQMFAKASRADKRKLVNQCVVRGPDGECSINVHSAILNEWNGKYVDVRSDPGLISKPAAQAAQAWGGWPALFAAKERGDVWVVTLNGRDYFQWREFKEIEREGQRGGIVTEGSRKLDLPSYKQLNGALSHYGCSLDLTPAAIAGPPPKSIKGMSVDLSGKVLENLGKVQKACDRAISDGKGVYRRIDELGVADNTAKALGVKMKADIEATPSQDIVPDPH